MIYALLQQPVGTLSGIGTQIASRLKKRQVQRVGDLLLHLPKHYVDDRNSIGIAQLQEGCEARTQGRICQLVARGSAKQQVIEIHLEDDAGDHLLLRFFHSSYLKRDARLTEGQQISVRGTLALWQGKKQMLHPSWLPLAQFQACFRPEYAKLAGLSSARLQTLIQHAFSTLSTRPHSPLDAEHDLSLYQALYCLHYPSLTHEKDVLQAKKRLVLEELHVHLQLMQQQRQQAQCNAPVLVAGRLTQQFINNLPWSLTPAQAQVWQEIQQDLGRGQRMHRLLQGDVGAGKTCIAALSLLCACDQQQQAALMVPTEVLAQQHAETLAELFEPLGIKLGLLTASLKKVARRKLLQQLKSGDISLLVGTHALLSEDVCFANLSLAIVDEQHRFGVKQRWALTEKGNNVHLLAMTATPIPRSLALALYGDMDLSIMQGVPPGRKPIITTLLNHRQLPQLAAGMQRIVQNKGLIYWVVPRIEDDEVSDASVEKRQHDLAQHFPNWKVLALHGRMKASEKKQVLAQFSDAKAQILVSTTVVEVGVHIAEGRLMVIDEAQQYGLAQLHQLRGRVGRSDEQSYCVLITGEKTSESALKRLQHVCHSHDGLALAELDLETRGMGDALGIRQSGDMAFRLLDPVRDALLIQQHAKQPLSFKLSPEMLSFWKEAALLTD